MESQATFARSLALAVQNRRTDVVLWAARDNLLRSRVDIKLANGQTFRVAVTETTPDKQETHVPDAKPVDGFWFEIRTGDSEIEGQCDEATLLALIDEAVKTNPDRIVVTVERHPF